MASTLGITTLKTDVDLQGLDKGLNQAERQAQGFTNTLGDTADGASKSSLRITELASTLSLAKEAYGAVTSIARETYAAIKQGADLKLAQQQFDNLSASIGSTSDAILGDLSGATAGMMSNAEQISSASQIISLGLADNQKDVVDLASLVSQLGWDMNTVILTFANNSKARLDSLGLSVSDVEGRMKALEAQGYDTDKAFDLAVIEAGKAKLELLGSSADTSVGDIKRLEASWKDLGDAMKMWANDAAAPAIEQVSNVASGAANVLNSFSEAEDDLTRAGRMGLITREEYNQALLHGGRVGEEYAALVAKARDELEKFDAEVTLSEEEMRALAPAIEAAAAADRLFFKYTEAGTVGVVERTEAAVRGAAGMDAYRRGVEHTLTTEEAMEVAAKNTAEAQAELAAQTAAAAAKMDYLAGVVNNARSPIEDLFQAQVDLTAAQGEWVETTRDSSRELTDINAQLAADLSSDQKKAYQDILGTVDEGGAEWLSAYQALQGDLTDAQRAALVAQQADLQNAQGEIINVYTGDAAAAEEAQKRMDEANAAISKSYQDAALQIALNKISEVYKGDALAAQEAYLTTQVAMGQISQDQADALLNVAEKTQRVNDVTAEMMDKYLSDGELTKQEAENIAEAVALIEDNTYLTNDAIILMADNGVKKFGVAAGAADGLQGSAANAAGAVMDIKNKMALLQDKTVTITTNHIDRYTSEGGAGQGGSTRNDTGGRRYAAGTDGWMRVPGPVGAPQPITVHGGEIMNIRPYGQGVDGGGMSINGPLIGQVVQQPGESTDAFAQRVVQLASDARLLQQSGAY